MHSCDMEEGKKDTYLRRRTFFRPSLFRVSVNTSVLVITTYAISTYYSAYRAIIVYKKKMVRKLL